MRADRLDLVDVGLHARQIAGMTREMLDHRPRRQALGGQVARRRPRLHARFEVGGLVLDRNELLVAHQALYVLDVRRSRLKRQRRVATGSSREVHQRGQELGRLGALFAALALNELRQQLSQQQPVLDRQRRVLDAELGLGDLVLVELPQSNGHTVGGGRDVL